MAQRNRKAWPTVAQAKTMRPPKFVLRPERDNIVEGRKRVTVRAGQAFSNQPGRFFSMTTSAIPPNTVIEAMT
jgi:hypothetical protein